MSNEEITINPHGKTGRERLESANVINNKKSSVVTENVETIKEEKQHSETSINAEELQEQLEQYKKKLDSTRLWGHGEKRKNVMAQKQINNAFNEFVKYLEENEAVVFEEEQLQKVQQQFQEAFNIENIHNEEKEEENNNQYTEKEQNFLNKYKSWTETAELTLSDEDLDNYKAFFIAVSDKKFPEKIADQHLNYLSEIDNKKEAIRYILDYGKQYNEIISPINKEEEGLFGYIKKLTSNNEKLTKELNEIKKLIDNNPKIVKNRTISNDLTKKDEQLVISRYGKTGRERLGL